MASVTKLCLADIRDLGGTKADLDFLKGIDEDSASELEFEEPSAAHDSTDCSQIKAFIESIGLNKGQGQGEFSGKGVISRLKLPSSSSDERGTEKKKKKKAKKITSTEDEIRGGGKCHPAIERRLMKIGTKTYKKLLVPMDNDKGWFEESNSEIGTITVSPATLGHLISVGETLMKAEVELYEKIRQKNKGPGDVHWLKTVLSSGTLNDRVAALTLLIQESPVHTLSSVDSLLAMAAKKNKRESILAADAFKDLLISDLLPEDRKLKSMKQRPLNSLVDENLSDRVVSMRLVLWYYEDQLKAKFAKFLGIVKVLSHDSVANVREKMLGYVFDLLYRKPEQEQELLSQLVNKLGDPARKVASKSVLFLLKLLNHHVNMKTIVAKEIENLLHRPNISPKAQYYAVCVLNQFVITQSDQELATRLVEIYFTFFKAYTKKRELDTKMLAALLTGVNRAFPFIKGEIASFEDQLHSLFKVVYVGPLATGIQSLMLLYQVMESRQAVSGRYYQALYTKLMDPQLKRSGKQQAIFLNLLFKSVKNDPETSRVKAFLKRILQVLKVHPNLWSFVLQSESTDEEHFADLEEAAASPHGCGPALEHSKSTYQITSRNPLYCRAERTSLWELVKFESHYHPSVQAFSKKIRAGEHIEYHGDPLQDFTLVRFLDRFVCKNPKQKISDHGGSLMQRTSKLIKSHQNEVAVNSAQFADLDESKVREDELFMHRYFVQKALLESKEKKRKRKDGEKEKGVDEDDDSSSDIRAGSVKMDFAWELEKQKRQLSSEHERRKKRKSREAESNTESEEEGDGEMSEESSMDEREYSDNDDLLSGEDSLFGDESDGGAGGDTSEAQMEQLLLENLSSSDEEDIAPHEKSIRKPSRKKRRSDVAEEEKGFDVSSMFAAAEEFAHLLEESGSNSKEDRRFGIGGNPKRKKYPSRGHNKSRTKTVGKPLRLHHKKSKHSKKSQRF